MNFSRHQTDELRFLRLNLGSSFIEKSAASFIISISTSNTNLWNSDHNNDNYREIELLVQYPPKYPNASPQLAINIINGHNSLNPDKLIQIAHEVANQQRLKSQPCILEIVNQLRKHLKQTTTTMTTPTAVNFNYNVPKTGKSLRRRLRMSQRLQLHDSHTLNNTINIITEDEAKIVTTEAKADVKKKHRQLKKCNKTDENKRREENQRSDNEDMKEGLIPSPPPLQISPKLVRKFKRKLQQFRKRRRIKNDEIDRFWDSFEVKMKYYLKFEVNVESIIYLQTPLRNDKNTREFIRDCSLITKLNVEQCKKLVNDIDYWITKIKQFEEELICFNNKIEKFCSIFDSESEYARKLNDLIESNESQYDKLDSFMKIVDNIYGEENLENCLILKHFSCLAPFRIKNCSSKNGKNDSTAKDVVNSKWINVKTQIKNEIIYYSKCMVKGVSLQHELALLSDCENEKKQKDNINNNNSEVDRIIWDNDSIRHGQFNFTRYLCEKYFEIGMYCQVANLIAVYAGLGKYDYECDQMPNTKNDVNICFIKLNGKMTSKLSLKNIIDNCQNSKWFSNYGKRVPMQSICEIPFDCTKLTDWIREGRTMSCKRMAVNIQQIRKHKLTFFKLPYNAYGW